MSMEPLEFKPRLITAEPAEEERAPTNQEREAISRELSWREALMYMRVPNRYREIPLSMPLLPAISEWQGDPWSVTILGPAGSGKTWQAVRLFGRVFGPAQHNPNMRGRAMFMDASAAVEEMRSEISGATTNTLARLSALGGLLLDDYGAERDTEFARDRLSVLLRERYNWQRPTIVTSNVESLAEIEPRLASRLSSGIVLELKGRDRRLA